MQIPANHMGSLTNAQSRGLGANKEGATAELWLTWHVDMLPAAYIGEVLVGLDMLYQSITNEALILAEARPGSLIMIFKGTWKMLRPFGQVLD